MIDWYHRRTYVFVSDPTQGYGLYVDWMLQCMGMPPFEASIVKGSMGD